MYFTNFNDTMELFGGEDLVIAWSLYSISTNVFWKLGFGLFGFAFGIVQATAGIGSINFGVALAEILFGGGGYGGSVLTTMMAFQSSLNQEDKGKQLCGFLFGFIIGFAAFFLTSSFPLIYEMVQRGKCAGNIIGSGCVFVYTGGDVPRQAKTEDTHTTTPYEEFDEGV